MPPVGVSLMTVPARLQRSPRSLQRLQACARKRLCPMCARTGTRQRALAERQELQA
jgi:hypothetical protein